MYRGLALLFLLLASCTGAKKMTVYEPMEGDVLFQSLPNEPGMDLVDAIEGATESPYSHCGMVLRENDDWWVIEAIGPVKITQIQDYMDRGRDHKVWAYRFTEENRKHIPAALAAMKEDLEKPYDARYRFDSEAIYCSELIYRGWKAATGEGLGKVVTLGSLKWERYKPVIEAIEGQGNHPLDREMITPRDLAKAPQLKLVYSKD
jgi:uncharacterized protein YycO